MSDRSDRGVAKAKTSRGEDPVDTGGEVRVGTRGALAEKPQDQCSHEKKSTLDKKETRPRAKVGPFGYIGVTREGGEKRRFIAHVAVG